MDIPWIITIFLIGFVGSYVSGMLGIGGSIIKYPMLLYIPPMLGFAAFSAHEVSGISAVQVLFASIAGVWAYRKGGYLNKSLIIYMGGAILIGSIVGSFGSKSLSEDGVNIVYGVLALIAAIMMFIPKKKVDDIPLDEVTFNKPLAAISSVYCRYWLRNCRCGRRFLVSTDYACRIKNSYTYDDCNESCDNVYFFYRGDHW